MRYFSERTLSARAAELVQFDADSIRQIACAERAPEPETWLADPDEYEKNGRILRDSPNPRMLAYSSKTQKLYATDGCNSCARGLNAGIDSMRPEELQVFAQENDLRLELLQRLAELAAQAGR